MSQVVAELKGIVKHFPGVCALAGVSFDIRAGEVHALCGENGAGKSTLIKIMTGAYTKDSGEYLIDGVPVSVRSTHDTIALGISCVYQELSIAPQLDVAKNLFIGNLPMTGRFVDHKKMYAEAERILRLLDVKIPVRTPAGELSIGQQQMVEIGRALTRNARIIIMDEPTSSLSEKEADILFQTIRKLKDRNISIVYISHKLDEVMELSDRITVIKDGEHVISMDTGSATQDELIAYMIGRPLENLYRKSAAKQGGTVLEVKGLTSPGIFEDVSFSVKKGEVLGFFGLVGAGRSEIMRAIFGVDKYKSGEVILDGKKLQPGSPASSISAGIGFATENRKKEGLMLRLSVLLNMTIVKLPSISKAGFINKKEQAKLVGEYVKSISIKTPSPSQLVSCLSGGNQQKVVVAKWLMTNPKVLIVDEPTRGIDVGSKSEIYGLISELANQGVAIIVVSSEIEEIMGVCDRVVTVCEGCVMDSMPITGTSNKAILASALGKRQTGAGAEVLDGASRKDSKPTMSED